MPTSIKYQTNNDITELVIDKIFLKISLTDISTVTVIADQLKTKVKVFNELREASAKERSER
jgi:hypothetical protein